MSGGLVFAHYFTPYVISFSNEAQPDYYARNYLDPYGEGGAHIAYGGLLRDRPIIRAPLSGSNWRRQDMATEIQRAKAIGLDGFTVDLLSTGSTDQNGAAVLNLINQAATEGNFKILLMPDMTSGPGSLSATALAAYIATLKDYSPIFRLSNGHLVISPFGFEQKNATYWSLFMSTMSGTYGETVAMVPCTIGPAAGYYSTYNGITGGIYGWSEWGSRYPGGNPTGTGVGTPKANIATVHAGSRIWMQPVSAQDSRPRSSVYWECQNTTNLRNTWDIAINGGADWVQIPTWNDYSENAHISPSAYRGEVWSNLMGYYIQWFKTGVQPAMTDDIVLTHRTQYYASPNTFNESSPMILQNGGSTPAQDKVEALVFLTATSDVNIHVGGTTTTSSGLAAGIHAVSANLGSGTISADIVRSSTIINTVTSSYTATNRPYVQDLQYLGVSSMGLPLTGGGSSYSGTAFPDVTGSGWVRNNVKGTTAGTSVTMDDGSSSWISNIICTGTTLPAWAGLNMTFPIFLSGYADWIDIGILDTAASSIISNSSPGNPPFPTSFWGIRLDIYNGNHQFIADGSVISTTYTAPANPTPSPDATFTIAFHDAGGGNMDITLTRSDQTFGSPMTATVTAPGFTSCYAAIGQRSGGLGMTAKVYNTASWSIGPVIAGATSHIAIASNVGVQPNWILGASTQIVLGGGAEVGQVAPLPVPTAVFQLFAQEGYGTGTTGGDNGGGNTTTGGGANGGFLFTMETLGRVRQSSHLVLPTMRPGLIVNANMPSAAIRNGHPYVPKIWITPSSALTCTMGTGHGVVIPDPTPTTAPLPGGITAPTYRWSVEDLTDPAGTPYGLSDWTPHGGTGPHWTSSGVYQPTVREHVVFGRNNAYHTFTKSLLFHPADVNHMWLDMGSAISQPFTFMFAGIINSYPTRTYGHYLLDAGKATPTLDVSQGRDYRVKDGLSYRSLMLFQRTSAILCTRPVVEQGVYVRSSHNYVPRARVFFGVFNGSNSYIGYFDHENQVIKHGKVDTKTHRYFVTGRRTNYVSDNLATHMTMFEIRYFGSALSKTHLLSNYRQMAAQWKFNHYNEI